MLNDIILDILKEEDVTVTEYRAAVKIEFDSYLGEFFELHVVGTTNEEFIRGFNNYTRSFNPDDHAIKNYPEYGLEDLLDDAKWIKKKLIRINNKMVDAIVDHLKNSCMIYDD